MDSELNDKRNNKLKGDQLALMPRSLQGLVYIYEEMDPKTLEHLEIRGVPEVSNIGERPS